MWTRRVRWTERNPTVLGANRTHTHVYTTNAYDLSYAMQKRQNLHKMDDVMVKGFNTIVLFHRVPV